MNIILLSGGSGKRLWPLSNDNLSKQFLRLLNNPNGDKESMVQRVFRQLKETNIDGNIVIATGKSQLDSIQSQLGDVDVIVEPERRNTYPAILLACAYLKYKRGVKSGESVIVIPVDPYTENSFFETLKVMDDEINKNNSDLTLMGVKPYEPSEKYGYIICEDTNEEIKNVIKFQEKPTIEKAKELLSQGAYWNAGVFGFKLGYIMDILNSNFLVQSYEEVYDRFSELKKDSFDYEVVEKANSINMISYDGLWKDLGTWDSLTAEMPHEINGNVIIDDSSNTNVINVTDKPTVVLGINDAIVVNSTEGILISKKDKCSFLKQYVQDLNDRPTFENRRWGEYKVVDECGYSDGEKSLTKHLIIKSGKSISLQTHKHRREIWVIVDGKGELMLGSETKEVKRGDVINIDKGVKHKITAITDLHIVETQLGDQLTEDDIERYE